MLKPKPDYRAISRQREQQMATDALRVDAIKRHEKCEITEREVETGRAYERQEVAAAEKEAARRAKC